MTDNPAADAVSSSLNLTMAHTKVREASQDRNRASLGLDIALIQERFWECENQHEPLNTLMHVGWLDMDDKDRQMLRANFVKAMAYVVFGRKDW